MPKIDRAKAVMRRGGNPYPAAFKAICEGREKLILGDVAGLTQFGVNLTTLKPGAASALRHWHEQEDEFVYVLDGEITLCEDGGETVLRAGDAAGFKAGSGNAHCLINRTSRDVVYLEIGTRSAAERVHYPDIDLFLKRDAGRRVFTTRAGEPYRD